MPHKTWGKTWSECRATSAANAKRRTIALLVIAILLALVLTAARAWAVYRLGLDLAL